MQEQFIKGLKERQAQLSQDCLLFPREDFAQYQRLVGEYQGILFALQLLEDLQRQAEES
jgi:hypothetical protein